MNYLLTDLPRSQGGGAMEHTGQLASLKYNTSCAINHKNGDEPSRPVEESVIDEASICGIF